MAFCTNDLIYSIKGEMKPYAVLLWFLKPTFQMILIYTFLIILLFFPTFFRNDFFTNYFFGISFGLAVVVNIYFTIQKSNRGDLREMFEKFAISNNFYKNHYNEMKSYCDSGNLKKDVYNDFEGAIIDYTKAIKLNANYPSLYFNRGTAYLNKLDFDKAIKDFDSAIELDSSIPDFYNGRATAKRDSGDTKGAIADFLKSIELNPDNITTSINLHQLIKST